MALPASLQALQAAAQMKALNDPLTNVAQDFAGPSDPNHVPSQAEMLGPGRPGGMGSEDVADQAATALGGGPAIEAMQRMADFGRRNTFDNQAASDADLEGPDATTRAMAGTTLTNKVGDINSEAAAGRHFLPKQSAVDAQTAAAHQAEMTMKYLGGPQINAQSAHDTAMIHASEGPAAEAAKTAGLPARTMAEMLAQLVAKKGGGIPSPEDAASLQKLLALIPGAGGGAAAPPIR